MAHIADTLVALTLFNRVNCKGIVTRRQKWTLKLSSLIGTFFSQKTFVISFFTLTISFEFLQILGIYSIKESQRNFKNF